MLDIKLTAKNFELTDRMREYINKRLAKLDRYSKHILKSNIVFEEFRGRYKGEFFVEVSKKGLLKASFENSDFYALIDNLREKMEVQLKRFEEKLKRR
jgi:ribosomal subunit interface protein